MMGISYQKKRQTPKRGAGGSSPLWDAKTARSSSFPELLAVFSAPFKIWMRTLKICFCIPPAPFAGLDPYCNTENLPAVHSRSDWEFEQPAADTAHIAADFLPLILGNRAPNSRSPDKEPGTPPHSWSRTRSGAAAF